MDPVTILTSLGIPNAVAWGMAICTGANLLAVVLPHPAPGSRWALPRNAIDTLAGNWGHAANATPPTRSTSIPLGALFALLLLGGCTGDGRVNWNAVLPLAAPTLVCLVDEGGSLMAVADSADADQVKVLNGLKATGNTLAHDAACQASLAGVAAAAKG
jgi:hypothetical protein